MTIRQTPQFYRFTGQAAQQLTTRIVAPPQQTRDQPQPMINNQQLPQLPPQQTYVSQQGLYHHPQQLNPPPSTKKGLTLTVS